MAQSAGSIVIPAAIVLAGAALAFFIVSAPSGSLAQSSLSNEPSSPFSFTPARSVASLEKLRETRNRPVFNAARQPQRSFTPAATQTVDVTPPEEIELVGTRALGNQRAALLRVVGDDDTVWLEEGETLAGWSLERIETTMIEICNQNDRAEIWLEGRHAANTQNAPD